MHCVHIVDSTLDLMGSKPATFEQENSVCHPQKYEATLLEPDNDLAPSLTQESNADSPAVYFL